MKTPDSSQSPQQMPQMQRLIVTFGGASILFASLISIVTDAFKLGLSDPVVAVVSFALGAVTAFWVLHGKKSKD